MSRVNQTAHSGDAVRNSVHHKYVIPGNGLSILLVAILTEKSKASLRLSWVQGYKSPGLRKAHG